MIKQSRSRFHVAMAAALAATVVVGFARTYYLKGLFDTPALTPLAHAHSLVFSAWLLVFIAQAGLVASGRVDLHRRMGTAGVGLVVLMVPLGVAISIESARLGHSRAASPLAFMSVPIVNILVFGVLAGAGLVYRRRPEVHKRLMVLASLSLVGPAMARLWEAFARRPSPVLAWIVTGAFLVVCLAHDLLRRGRIHPAYWVGGSLLAASLPLRFAIGHTEAWTRIARWMVGP